MFEFIVILCLQFLCLTKVALYCKCMCVDLFFWSFLVVF